MRAPTARRPTPVACILQTHGCCGGVCRGVAGVGCGGGSFAGGLGLFGCGSDSIWRWFGSDILDNFEQCLGKLTPN
jgi:hypothetical protein